MDFSHLYFRNVASFKSLAIIEAIAEASKIFEFTATIDDRSILVVSNYDTPDILLELGNVDKMFMELLSCGTKVIDAIAFLQVCRMPDSNEKSELKGKFEYQKSNGYTEGAFEESCAGIAAAYVIAVTRGSLPGSNMSSAKNPLPQFVNNMFVKPPANELQLSQMIMSFDPKHVNLTNLFVEKSLKGWPEEIANRMNLGVAGHKIMKACQMLRDSFIEADSHAVKICVMLAELANKANGGFYPGLHPANNRLKGTYQKFYAQSLKALFDCLKGVKESKYVLLETTGAFKSEALVQKKTLDRLPSNYMTWDIDSLVALIGQPVKFDNYNVIELKRLEMPKRADFPMMKAKGVVLDNSPNVQGGEISIVSGMETSEESSGEEQISETLGKSSVGALKEKDKGKQEGVKKGEKGKWIEKKGKK